MSQSRVLSFLKIEVWGFNIDPRKGSPILFAKAWVGASTGDESHLAEAVPWEDAADRWESEQGSRNLCSVSWFQLCLWAAPPGLSCGFLSEPANYPLSLKPVVLQLATRWNLMLGTSPGLELGQRSFLKVPKWFWYAARMEIQWFFFFLTF